MSELKKDKIRESVSRHYARVAGSGGSCCDPGGSDSCCGPVAGGDAAGASPFAYLPGELADLPEGANLNLGCGNPTALAGFKPGETVLDLGSGGGVDCFMAARKVGPEGLVIGVDMTREMISKARQLAREHDFANVEFRLGELENLPVADNSVDVIISNCVINLSPDKPRVLQEAHRVLKPGGRLTCSDMVALKPLPAECEKDESLYCGCIGGAAHVEDLKAMLDTAGFMDVDIRFKEDPEAPPPPRVTLDNLREVVKSAGIRAVKPG